MVFLSPFLDVTRMSMSTVSFLTQPDYGILPCHGVNTNFLKKEALTPRCFITIKQYFNKMK